MTPTAKAPLSATGRARSPPAKRTHSPLEFRCSATGDILRPDAGRGRRISGCVARACAAVRWIPRWIPKGGAALAATSTPPAALETDHHTEIRNPSLCPELRLRLLDRHSPLGRAVKRHGLYAVHEVFPGLSFPPHWVYAFAGGQALARFVLDHPERVMGRNVLDMGTGSGLVAIAAARAGACRVVALDRDPLALAAASNNASLNGVSIETRASDVPGFDPEGFEVILASEVFYDDDRVLRYLDERAADGASVVVVADSGRGIFSPTDADELARYASRTEPDLEWVEKSAVYQLRGRKDPSRSV